MSEKYFFNEQNIEVSIAEITPQNASHMLETINIGNRKLAKSRVEQYVRDMKNGEWRFNGDVIRIDENGALIDGQHRLNAVVRSGISCEFLIVKGVASETKHTIDTGKSRTGGDALSIQANVSQADSHTISGAITLHSKYLRSGFGETSGGTKLTNSQILNYYGDNKQLINESLALLKSNTKTRGLLLAKSEVLFLFMVFCDLDKTDAENYMKKIMNGSELTDDSTEHHIRQVMIENKMGVRKLNKKIVMNSILKCWNTIRGGRSIKNINNVVWRITADKPVIAK